MKTSDIIQIIGPETKSVIAAGKFGDASLHANGFVTGDPCYFHDDAWYKELCATASSQQPHAYRGQYRGWVEIQFRGQTCYFTTCSDGYGPLRHCVDAGWVVAIPLALCPQRVQDLFQHETCHAV